MSTLLKGKIVDTDLSRNARGGTEQMRDRLLNNVSKEYLSQVAIHFSRVRNFYQGVPNIYYAHDLAEDPECFHLKDGGWNRYAKIVFVSYWQRDQFIAKYGIPHSKCTVIENAIELEFEAKDKPTDEIRFIYHTTPHRGLRLLVPIFEQLCKDFDNIHLDVFSSFEVYGWKERDAPYQALFNQMKNHPKMTYHGAQSNEVVLNHLSRANIFLYPSIWQETSCIAMIEAIKSGCLVIHPSLAALTETSAECTIMYDYTEDHQEHARRAYKYAKKVLECEKDNPGFINNYMSDIRCELPRNSIEAFTGKWNDLLEQLVKNQVDKRVKP